MDGRETARSTGFGTNAVRTHLLVKEISQKIVFDGFSYDASGRADFVLAQNNYKFSLVVCLSSIPSRFTRLLLNRYSNFLVVHDG
jgi:hypothetical protein